MQPFQIIIIGALVAGVFYFRKHHARLRVALGSAVMELLDGLVAGYAIYLAVAFVFDFGSFRTWSGAARVLFFTSKPDGGQFFALLIGIIASFARFVQAAAGAPSKNRSEYVGGRRVWCHNSALIVADALLAKRADETRNGKPGILALKRPQHLDPQAIYSRPEKDEPLDLMTPVPELETNKALTPYVPEEDEYPSVLWGMLRIPYSMTTQHFLVVGATGGGKSLKIHALMRSVLPRIQTQKNFRAFVYDDKLDFLPLMRQMGLEEYVWNLDPFDANGYAWDIAADVTTPAEAKQVAAVLAPVDEKVSDEYWQRATQDFLGAVLENFMTLSPKRRDGVSSWTLRDVVLTFSSVRRLTKVLERDPETLRKANFYLGSRSLRDVLAVLSSKLSPYRIAAALYDKAKDEEENVRKRSVREWRKSNAILLVTGRSAYADATKPINQAIFRMVSLLLLNTPDVDPRKEAEKESNWIFLDEIREIGKLQGYHELANKGRSKGVRLVIGFQSLEGLMAEHGPDAANEIANLCSHRTFLHTTSPITRAWEAEQLGNSVIDETVFNFSVSVSSHDVTRSTSWQTNTQTRAAMEASDFDQNVKLVTPENGFTAVNMIPYIGTYVSWVPWNWIEKNDPYPEPIAENLRTGEDQRLKEWDTADFTRLNLDPKVIDDDVPSGEEDKKTKKKEAKKEKERKEKEARKAAEAKAKAEAEKAKAEAEKAKQKSETSRKEFK